MRDNTPNAPTRDSGGKIRVFLAAALNRCKNRCGVKTWSDLPTKTGYYLMAKQIDGDQGRVVAGELVEAYVGPVCCVFIRKAVGRWVTARVTDRTGWVQYYGPIPANWPYFGGFN